MWTLWHTTASRQRCARPMLGERKGKKGRKKRERAHGRLNISSKSGKGRVGLSWESSGRRSAAAHRGRAKLTGLKKTHWMSTWTNVYLFFSSFFFSKPLNCTDLKHLFPPHKKTGLFRSPENSMSLARANKITMNADPCRLDGILPMKDVFFTVISDLPGGGEVVCSLERTTVDFSASAHQLLWCRFWKSSWRLNPTFPWRLTLRCCLRAIIRPQFPFPFFRRDSPTALGSTQQDAMRTSGVISMHVSFSAERQTNADTHFTLATCQWDHV